MKTRIVLTVLWALLMLIVSATSDRFYFSKEDNFIAFVSTIFLSFKISLISCFFVFVLSGNDMIFGWYRLLINQIAERYIYKDGKQNPQRVAIANDLMKPILTCEVCVTLNVAFWTYVAISRKEFVLIDLLFIISMSGLITLLTTTTWQKIAK